MLVCNFSAHLGVPCGISWEKVELSGSLGDQNTTTTKKLPKTPPPVRITARITSMIPQRLVFR